jgi:hypothetical protein
MCPYYLDGDLRKTVQVFPRVRTLRFSPGDTRYIGYCAVFKVREEMSYAVTAAQGPKPSERRRHAGLSKLNSMWQLAERVAIERNQDFSRHPALRATVSWEKLASPNGVAIKATPQVRSTCLVTEMLSELVTAIAIT